MNAHLAKFMMYYEVHKLHREGHSLTKIGILLVLNRRTVTKYFSMTEVQYEAHLIEQTDRKKELLAYEEFTCQRLRTHPDTPASQMHDWLKEHHTDFPKLNAKTVFNFVHWVRTKYNIPKTSVQRHYQMVEELPYGKQAQVDFGEYNLRTTTGQRVKVFFFTLVLSRSRYKYIWFTDQYFTSQLAIQAHEQAFAYIGGIPDEIVYDQDKVFIVNENRGDLILTDQFRNYTRVKSFQLHFCRKADPESKGKVENVVKFVKQNFLYNRTYYNIETLNDDAMGWLGRTANAMPHGVTLKEPHSEWIIELKYLKEQVALPIKTESVLYTVRKDNTISWKSNFYSLPLGTYAGRGTQVGVQIKNDDLLIFTAEGTSLCQHKVAYAKGVKIINTDHKRDKNGAIGEMIRELAGLTQDPLQVTAWLMTIRAAKPRYIRDQLLLIRQTVEKTQQALVTRAIAYCLANSIASAVDFTAIIREQQRASQPVEHKIISLNPLSGTHLNKVMMEPNKSDIQEYQKLLKK